MWCRRLEFHQSKTPTKGFSSVEASALLVSGAGFEPATSCIPRKRATRLRYTLKNLVCVLGFEPRTPTLRRWCSTKLSYTQKLDPPMEGAAPALLGISS